MSNESRFCGNCGAPMSGSFCGACGAPAADVAADVHVQDAPTRMVSGEEPTSHRPEVDPRIAGAETGWYQSADAPSGVHEPYAGVYDSAPYAGAGDAQGASAYTSAPYQSASAPVPPRRTTNTALIAAGLVTLLILACLGGFALMRGGGDTKHDATPPPSLSTSPLQPSPTSQSSSPTTQSTTSTPPAPVQTQIQTQTATVTSTTTSSTTTTPTQAPSNGIDSLSNLKQTLPMNGSTYGLTQAGTSVAIYESSDSGAKQIANISLPAMPDVRNPQSLVLVDLPGCSKPVLTFNSSRSSGSGAFGWDGTGYEVYKSTGENLEPIASGTQALGTYGVYVEDGAVVYKDSAQSVKHYFRSCASASPDALQWDH